MGFPSGASGKESTCQWRRRKRRGFSPWVGNVLWRRAWQPTPWRMGVFLPAESCRQGAWRATVHTVRESRTRRKRLAQHSLFFIHSSADGHLGGFRVLGVINSASVSIGPLASFHIRIRIFSGCVPGAGSLAHVAALFLVFKDPPTALQSGCTSLHSHQQCRCVPSSRRHFMILRQEPASVHDNQRPTMSELPRGAKIQACFCARR